jgi:prevent-host-death family protein
MGKPVINLYEAKSHLSELVDRAAAGEEIVIAKSGKPMARLIPVAKTSRRRSKAFGKNLMGVTYITPDFYEDIPMDFLLGEGDADTK